MKSSDKIAWDYDRVIIDVDFDDWHVIFLYEGETSDLRTLWCGHEGLTQPAYAALRAIDEDVVIYTHCAYETDDETLHLLASDLGLPGVTIADLREKGIVPDVE